MKNFILFFILILLGCKKNDSSTLKVYDFNQQKEHALFDLDIQGHVEEAMFDVNKIITKVPSLSGDTIHNEEIESSVVIDSSRVSEQIITLDYSKSISKSGKIRIQLIGQLKWKEINSKLSVTFLNYKALQSASKVPYTYNGTLNLVNLDGGMIKTGAPTHKQWGELEIGVNGSKTLLIHFASKKWYVPLEPQYVEIFGDTNFTTQQYVSIWGTNILGNSFSTSIWHHIDYRYDCGFRKPFGGNLEYHILDGTFMSLYGFTASGNQTNDCPSGFKLLKKYDQNEYTYIGYE